MTVPESSLDLTPEWCTVAFRSRGFLTKDEAIKKVSMKPLGAGEGEFSELVLLNIEEVIGGPHRAYHAISSPNSPLRT